MYLATVNCQTSVYSFQLVFLLHLIHRTISHHQRLSTPVNTYRGFISKNISHIQYTYRSYRHTPQPLQEHCASQVQVFSPLQGQFDPHPQPMVIDLIEERYL